MQSNRPRISACAQSDSTNSALSPTLLRGALKRAVSSASGETSAPTPIAPGISWSSATSRQPEPVPRSSTRRPWPPCRRSLSAISAAATTVSLSGRGTRVAGVSVKRKAPELPFAENARHGLAGQPPADMASELRRRRLAQLLARRADQVGVLQPGGIEHQQPRHRAAPSRSRRRGRPRQGLERTEAGRLGRDSVGVALFTRPLISRFPLRSISQFPLRSCRNPRSAHVQISAPARLNPRSAHAAFSCEASSAAWCSVISASISSSRALPAITASSL